MIREMVLATQSFLAGTAYLLDIGEVRKDHCFSLHVLLVIAIVHDAHTLNHTSKIFLLEH